MFAGSLGPQTRTQASKQATVRTDQESIARPSTSRDKYCSLLALLSVLSVDNGQIDRQTDRRTDRQMDGRTSAFLADGSKRAMGSYFANWRKIAPMRLKRIRAICLNCIPISGRSMPIASKQWLSKPELAHCVHFAIVVVSFYAKSALAKKQKQRQEIDHVAPLTAIR